MKKNERAGAASVERSATPWVAPRFTRAAHAERSRLQGRREQLLRKREDVDAELRSVDRAAGAIEELLELLAPRRAANGSKPQAAADGTAAAAEPGRPGANDAETNERDGAER